MEQPPSRQAPSFRGGFSPDKMLQGRLFSMAMPRATVWALTTTRSC
ncbi:hypothetical protein PCI56_03300 [Plesiomonas shigelloides subsp. oncorhynchi]|nr:hypothetical protein [Plesiomonas shigelloides]